MSKITTSPNKGDIVAYDADKKVRFIRYGDSFDGIPTGLTAMGVVSSRQGNEVLIVHKTNNSTQKWAEVFLWRLTGFTLDGASHTMTLTTQSVTATINYSATTLEQVASQIDAVVRPMTFGTHKYTCYVRDGEVILQHDTYTAYSAVTATGATITAWVGSEMVANAYMERFNGGRSGEGSVFNLNRALLYFRNDNSSTSYNPNTDVTSLNRSYPICLPAYLGTSQYQSDHCAYLRSYYGEGVEGWLRFMKAQMVVNPSMTGVFNPDYRDGHYNTYLLAGQKFVKPDGTEAVLYPAFDYVAAQGFAGVEGFEQGDWYLPSTYELADIIKDVTYPAIYKDGAQVNVARADADIVNRALNAIGGTAISNGNGTWSSCRYYSSGAWGFGGGSGFGYGNNYYNRFVAIPCVLYKLKY